MNGIIENIIGSVFLPACHRAYELTQRAWRLVRQKPSPSIYLPKIEIVVASLEGDDLRGRQTRHIERSLAREFGTIAVTAPVHIQRSPTTLKFGQLNDTWSFIEASKKASDLLKKYDADILIWGEVASPDKALHIRIYARAGSYEVIGQTYGLGDAMTLPGEFFQRLGGVMAALVEEEVEHLKSGSAPAAALRPTLERLEHVCAHPPSSFSRESAAQLLQASALGWQRLGEQAGDLAELKTALDRWGEAKEIWKELGRDTELEYTENAIGICLGSLGAIASGTGQINDAVDHMRALSERLDKEQDPFGWARAHCNLAMALTARGERSPTTDDLKSAADAYRACLEIVTKEADEDQWALLQNNLGVVTMTIGLREEDMKVLASAETCFRNALEVRKPEDNADGWQETMNNLGVVFQYAGRFIPTPEPFREAMRCHVTVLQKLNKDDMPVSYALTTNNLANAMRGVARRIDDNDKLIEGYLEAYRDAIETLRPTGVDYQFRMVEANLTAALSELDAGGNLLPEKRIRPKEPSKD